jgi:HD-like signal output (HDOD) protein
LRPEKEDPNPIKLGFQFVQYLKEHPDSTYDELEGMSGVSKARICQMVALHKRLPAPITDYLMNNDEPEVLKYFSERRLRPLTLLATDDEKLRQFEAMKEAM